MAEETKEVKTETTGKVDKHDKKELAMRYLAALLQYADWVPEDYMKLVTKNSSVELLQQIYLCACDRVPMEKLQEARNEKDGAKELARLRYEYLKKSLIKEYESELEELRKRLATAEAKIVEQEHKIQNVPKFGTVHTKETEQIQSPTKEDISDRKTSVSMHKKKRGYFRRKSESPAVFLSEILNEYNMEQLKFIVDCIEEGIPVRDIRAFISPVFPVEIMQRLKTIEQEKGGKKKWNRIEK